MLNNCVLKLQSFRTFTLLYLTLLVFPWLRFWTKWPKLKREEAGSRWKSERQKLQRLYTQAVAAYGSVRNLVKASKLSVAKVRHFLHSNCSYTKFALATRKFKPMKAFDRFKNQICCGDLACVVKVAKGNNGVKYLPNRQELFGRTVDAKGMKTKNYKETVRAILTMITKTIRPKKFGLTWQQNLQGSLENYANLKEYNFTLHWVRPRLHLLNVPYHPWKIHLTVTLKTMDTNTFTNWLKSLQQ